MRFTIFIYYFTCIDIYFYLISKLLVYIHINLISITTDNRVAFYLFIFFINRIEFQLNYTFYTSTPVRKVWNLQNPLFNDGSVKSDTLQSMWQRCEREKSRRGTATIAEQTIQTRNQVWRDEGTENQVFWSKGVTIRWRKKDSQSKSNDTKVWENLERGRG